MKIIIMFMLTISCLFPVTNYLISERDFKDLYMVPDYKYYQEFAGNIGSNRVSMLIRASRYYGINPLVLFTTLQKETSGLYGNTNRLEYYALGCAMHADKKRGIELYASFKHQVWKAAQALYINYNTAYRRKNTLTLLDDKKPLRMANKATYALYTYTPLYKMTMKTGVHGNYLFESVWNDLLKRFDINNNPEVVK